MSLLPAVVPDIPEARAELVPARIARKVAPLFGVAWPGGPFGAQSWVSDYGKITLSEIARGAPLPTRSQAARLATEGDRDWQLVDRVAVTRGPASLPHEIANATLNRFGPDTKAAVVLTAANRLLGPVTEAIEAALPFVIGKDSALLPVSLRIATWAGLLLEVFRSQPALVAAGIRARTIQRELVTWTVPLAAGLDGFPLTRCEIGTNPEPDGDVPGSPRALDVADQTFAALQLSPGWQQPPSEPDGRLLDDAVDLLLRRLLAIGTPNDASHLWLSEREPGQLVLEAHVPPTPIVDLFVRQAVRMLGFADDDPARLPLPVVPRPEHLAALTPLARRAVVIGQLSVLRQIQFHDVGRDATRDAVLRALRQLRVLVRKSLTRDDPLQALARCRIADMAVQTLRHDVRNDISEPVAELRAALRRVQQLFRAGIVDRGAAAEAISSANVELNAVRWTNAVGPHASGLPTPAELFVELRDSWRVFHEALQISSPRAEREAGYHLHNYAAFLAGTAEDDELDAATDLALSIRLFTDVVIPAREAFYAATGVFRPLRHSLQVASRATTRLAGEAWRRNERDAARAWADQGLRWIQRILDDQATSRMLDPAAAPTEHAVRLALLAVPALLAAVRTSVTGAGHAELETARRHLMLVSAWEASLGGGEHHTRHGEVLALHTELAELAST
jgi:hypothetical protein